MFERFTDRSRRAIMLAQIEARQLWHPDIGTEHILLGLIEEGEGIAAQVLKKLGFTAEGIRERVIELVPKMAIPSLSPPLSPRAKMVLEFSLREALQLGHNYIGTEHLLLGLVRESEGVSARVLNEGADLPTVQKAVMDTLKGFAAQEGTVCSSCRDTATVTVYAHVYAGAALIQSMKVPFCGVHGVGLGLNYSIEGEVKFGPAYT